MVTDNMVELLNYKNVILKVVNLIMMREYDREYIVSQFDDEESDNWHIMKKCYLTQKDKWRFHGWLYFYFMKM